MTNQNETTPAVARYPVTLDALDLAVIAQLGGTARNVDDGCEIETDAADVLNAVCCSSCGVAGGFPGFIYYFETREFFKANRDEIAARIREQIEEGLFENADGVISAVKMYNCLKGCDAAEIEEEAARAFYGPTSEIDSCELDTVANACAWGALEDLAFRLDGQRIEDDEAEND